MRKLESARTGLRMRARRAFSLVEIAVAAAVLSLVMVGVHHVLHVAARGSSMASSVEGSLRGMSIGLARVGRDVRLMAPKDLARDLSIARDGRSFSIRVPASLDGDFWSMDLEVVTYELVALPGDLQQLVRRDRTGVHPVGSCVITDMLVQYLPPGKLGSRQGYLQVTLIGPRPSADAPPLVAAELLPLRRVRPPRTFASKEVSL